MALKQQENATAWFIFIMGIIVVTNVAVIFDIPFLRPVFGIMFLAFIPGLLLLFLLKLHRLSIAEKLVLIIGMSAAFLMFYVWSLNQVSVIIFGYMSPLSTEHLTILLSLTFMGLATAAYLTNREAFSPGIFKVALNMRSKLCLILPAIFPLISIAGTYVINTSGSNIILMTFLFLVPVSIVLIVWQRRNISPDTYPIAIVLIAAGLLSIFWLRSEYVLGHDIHLEYYYFQKTLIDQYWGLSEPSLLSTTLSISILPVTYQSLLDVNGPQQLFKGMVVMICLFTPLSIFIVARKHLGDTFAFLAALFFSFGGSFLFVAGSPRTSIAIFFFALAVMLLFNHKIPTVRQRVLFIVFIAAVVVSHYSTSFITFFILLFAFLLGQVFRKNLLSKTITVTTILMLFTLIFLWHSQITGVSFAAGVRFVNITVQSLGQFAVAESRSGEALAVVGGGGMRGNPNISWMHFAVTWVSFIFIATGVIGTLIRRKTMLAVPQWGNSVSVSLKSKFDVEYLLMAIASSTLLVTVLVLPYISVGYDTQRSFHQAVVILSPFFVLGGIMLAWYLRANPHVLILVILIPYFLFNSGALYELFGFHDKTWVLSTESYAYRSEFVRDQESMAARWLGEHKDNSRIYIFDVRAVDKVTSQGGISRRLIEGYPRLGGDKKPEDRYIYLSHSNVVSGVIALRGEFINFGPYAGELARKNKLYANGGSEVYR